MDNSNILPHDLDHIQKLKFVCLVAKTQMIFCAHQKESLVQWANPVEFDHISIILAFIIKVRGTGTVKSWYWYCQIILDWFYPYQIWIAYMIRCILTFWGMFKWENSIFNTNIFKIINCNSSDQNGALVGLYYFKLWGGGSKCVISACNDTIVQTAIFGMEDRM